MPAFPDPPDGPGREPGTTVISVIETATAKAATTAVHRSARFDSFDLTRPGSNFMTVSRTSARKRAQQNQRTTKGITNGCGLERKAASHHSRAGQKTANSGMRSFSGQPPSSEARDSGGTPRSAPG